MYCKDCGKSIPDGARFCRECGAVLDQPQGSGAGQPQGSGAGQPQGSGAGQPQGSGAGQAQQRQQATQYQPMPYQATPQQPPPLPPNQAPQQQQRPQAPFQAQPPQQPPLPLPPNQALQQQQRPQAPYQAPPLPQPDAQPGKKPLGPAMVAAIVAIPVVLAAGALALYFFVFSKPGDGRPGNNASATTRTTASQGLLASQQTSAPAESTEATGTTEATARQTTAATSAAETTPQTERDIDIYEIAYSYLGAEPEPKVEFDTIDRVFPSQYRSLDYMVAFTGSCEYGQTDVMLEVEVPGFTQVYKQKVTLSRQLLKLRIVPPLLTGDLNLRSEKTAQLAYSVTDLGTGKILVQESKGILIQSKYDMIWWTQENHDMDRDNILSWMTPESPGILELKRNAIDYLESISDGQLNAMIGYQDYGAFDDLYLNTWVQAIAIQGAMGDINGVRYNNSAFSIDKDVQQRILTPDEVLQSKSGLCIETALVMASALQSAGMHVMLVLPPGHAQVAVEAWPGTGDYYLVETTVLPMPEDADSWNIVVSYLDKSEWFDYLSGEGYYTMGECYVVDCDLGKTLDILPMTN